MGSPESVGDTAAFAERLRAALQARGRKVSPTFLEREFNLRWRGEPVSVHAVRKWLHGQAMPTLDKVTVLARWLGVSDDWLRWGLDASGSPLVASEAGSHPDAAVVRTGAAASTGRAHPAGDEASLLQDYRLLTPTDRLAVRAVIDSLLSERRRQATDPWKRG